MYFILTDKKNKTYDYPKTFRMQEKHFAKLTKQKTNKKTRKSNNN